MLHARLFFQNEEQRPSRSLRGVALTSSGVKSDEGPHTPLTRLAAAAYQYARRERNTRARHASTTRETYTRRAYENAPERAISIRDA